MQAASEPNGRIFTDNAITGEIIRIIDSARTKVALVSPYIDRVAHVEQAIAKAIARDVRVTVFTRMDGTALGGSNSREAIDWYRQNQVEVVGVRDLHAKFYINETTAVVTSMNLLRSSWSGSLELGLVVSGEHHSQLVTYLNETIWPWADSSNATSTEVRETSARETPPGRRPSPKAQSNKSEGFFETIFREVKEVLVSGGGFCLRCRAPLTAADLDSGKVLCPRDYREWAKYKNAEFVEKYCTTCGREAKTSYARPQCRTCYANDPL